MIHEEGIQKDGNIKEGIKEGMTNTEEINKGKGIIPKKEEWE